MTQGEACLCMVQTRKHSNLAAETRKVKAHACAPAERRVYLILCPLVDVLHSGIALYHLHCIGIISVAYTLYRQWAALALTRHDLVPVKACNLSPVPMRRLWLSDLVVTVLSGHGTAEKCCPVRYRGLKPIYIHAKWTQPHSPAAAAGVGMQLYIGYTSGRNFDVCIVMTLNAAAP